ncbi:tRNA guanosine(34) transglycosylase Tgt [Candidatus Woesearchaeota archaeon]|nr:tRNA guanosine(34) transglycosylase Tgt [Candidatus Woesearchaeota archaeon]MBW3014471.1 tRNA guanosine(34) transglycosylase Tgt [Candidatus Woesearchaeota archaeon]
MFELKAESGGARCGILHTKHGKVESPFYMPVGTKVAVKNMLPEELYAMNVNAIICNAFILSLRPGIDIIKDAGGIHNYMKFNRCIFTDSGGFQVLSKSMLVEVNDRAVRFKDPFSGVKHTLTPEKSIQIQHDLGADVAMCLDDVPHYGRDYDYIAGSVKRTHLWAERCITAKKYTDDKQLLFGITQGGTFKDLREKSAKKMNELKIDGVAFGGLAIGESQKETVQALKWQLPLIDKNKPRYFMGLGSPDTMLHAIELGCDIFDSVYPTKNARRGTLFTREGPIKIGAGKYKRDFGPVEEDCKCYTCRNFSKSYVGHLLFVKETLGMRLATIHNLHFMQKLFEDIREAIKANEFAQFKAEFLKNYRPKAL